jgi:signal transduction histidine kinase
MNLSIVLLNMGDDYVRMQQPRKALSYLTQALHISQRLQDEEGIAWTYKSIAQAYHQLGQYNTSIQYAGMSLQKAQDLHLPEMIREACHTMYIGYQGLHQFDKALYYRNREIALNDSLYTLDKERQLKNLHSDYELEKKQHQIELLNKDKIIREKERVQDRDMLILSIAIAVLLGLGCFILYRSNAHKRRLNMVRNKLLSIIGHDLRSPIATLQGFVGLLQQSALSEEQIRYFSNKMNESLTNTSHMLNNLLYWAKSQMEGMQVNPGNIDLQAIIVQNKRLVQVRASEKKVTVLTDEADPPAIAYADEVMVDLVIRNLVENAIKFSRPGDTVTLSAVAGGKNISVTVADTGQGIPAADHHKIFNSSIVYTTTGTAREKGSGLGLSLCKELVEKNGGSIRFESTAGKGTSFTFTLPAAV